MIKKCSSALFCLLLFCSALLAQKKPEYRAGRLLKIEDLFIPAEIDKTHKANYLLYIRDGSEEYVARYRMTYFSHDKSKLLKPDSDVSYRISGKSLFVKTPDGDEIKSSLCEKLASGVKCGSDFFGSPSSP